MFNSIKKWLNGPIDDNSMFGNRIKKCYQTLFKKHSTETPPPTASENESPATVVINIQKMEFKPKPFDDSSFLNTILMEIQSRQLFLNANFELFSNSKIYLLEYDNLIEQLKNCISISDLSYTELQERINILNQVKIITTHCDTLTPIKSNPTPEENTTDEQMIPPVATPVVQVPSNVNPIKDMILVPEEKKDEPANVVIPSALDKIDTIEDQDFQPISDSNKENIDSRLKVVSDFMRSIPATPVVQVPEEKKEEPANVAIPSALDKIDTIEDQDFQPISDSNKENTDEKLKVVSGFMRNIPNSICREPIVEDHETIDTLTARSISNVSYDDRDEEIVEDYEVVDETTSARELKNLSDNN